MWHISLATTVRTMDGSALRTAVYLLWNGHLIFLVGEIRIPSLNANVSLMDATNTRPAEHQLNMVIREFAGNITQMYGQIGNQNTAPTAEQGWMVTLMDDFYFAIGPNPRDVFVVVGEKWILYKHCETEDLARAIVDGQNKRLEGKR